MAFVFAHSLFLCVMEHPSLTPRRFYHECLFLNVLNVFGMCAEGTWHFMPSEFARGENVNADTVISNICFRITRVSLLNIRIRTVIECGYHPLSTYEVIGGLDYYLNLYERLNNVVITICKLK
jgi:hypothetical protein